MTNPQVLLEDSPFSERDNIELKTYVSTPFFKMKRTLIFGDHIFLNMMKICVQKEDFSP